MPNWEGSNRKQQLPANWRELRMRVAQRAGWRCQNFIDGTRCTRDGSHCDHIRRGNDHSMDNLQWLCPPCHNTKSGREGAAAHIPQGRPKEAHPGLRPPAPLFRAP